MRARMRGCLLICRHEMDEDWVAHGWGMGRRDAVGAGEGRRLPPPPPIDPCQCSLRPEGERRREGRRVEPRNRKREGRGRDGQEDGTDGREGGGSILLHSPPRLLFSISCLPPFSRLSRLRPRPISSLSDFIWCAKRNASGQYFSLVENTPLINISFHFPSLTDMGRYANNSVNTQT